MVCSLSDVCFLNLAIRIFFSVVLDSYIIMPCPRRSFAYLDPTTASVDANVEIGMLGRTLLGILVASHGGFLIPDSGHDARCGDGCESKTGVAGTIMST